MKYHQTATILALASILTIASAVHAQTFQVIHTFTGQGDGGSPSVGVTIDAAGNLYGTTTTSNVGTGTTYELKRHGGGWILSTLHAFAGFEDGVSPSSRPLLAQDGTVYGTTGGGPGYGCLGGGCGTFYRLQPSPTRPSSPETPWRESFPHQFQGPPDDLATPSGDLLFDQSGNNIYGTALNGPMQSYCCGAVYELSRNGTGWTENILYAFQGGVEGGPPVDGVVADPFGNLFGAASGGGGSSGIIYELSPSGSGWTKSTVHTFAYNQDGFGPTVPAGDANGNLYGATNIGPPGYCGGTIWELSPTGDGGWSYHPLFCFTDGPPGSSGPTDKLVFGPSGSLYGTTVSEGLGYGTVFKLTPTANGWVYTLLHYFTGTDGSNPHGTITFDAAGNLYGTTEYGGNQRCNCGVVWEISQP